MTDDSDKIQDGRPSDDFSKGLDRWAGMLRGEEVGSPSWPTGTGLHQFEEWMRQFWQANYNPVMGGYSCVTLDPLFQEGFKRRYLEEQGVWYAGTHWYRQVKKGDVVGPELCKAGPYDYDIVMKALWALGEA